MDRGIVGEFGMECGDQHFALPHQDWVAAICGQHFDVRADRSMMGARMKTISSGSGLSLDGAGAHLAG